MLGGGHRDNRTGSNSRRPGEGKRGQGAIGPGRRKGGPG
jgi:hypothetical protein